MYKEENDSRHSKTNIWQHISILWTEWYISKITIVLLSLVNKHSLVLEFQNYKKWGVAAVSRKNLVKKNVLDSSFVTNKVPKLN